MIKFATLFLGLVVGSHEVELMVDANVAAVELRLDGDAVGRVDGEPWVVKVDFGRELAPARLEAIAYDASGNQIARAAQAINRPRPRAEAQLLLERDEQGRTSSVRLAWQSSEEDAPSEIVVTLDDERLTPARGRPLRAAAPRSHKVPCDPGRRSIPVR